MASFVKVCKITDIPSGTGKTVDVNGTAIALFNVDGTFYAINDTCIHRGGPLGEGELQGKIAICPWHGWRWDVTNGVNQLNPAVSVKIYEVKVEGEDVSVAG